MHQSGDHTILAPRPLELSLTRRIYYDIDVGDELTIIYHDGAFGIPFYTTPLHTGDWAEVK